MNQLPGTTSQKFLLYARKSTDNEDMQVRSIGDQLSVLREFAKSEGLEVCEEFIEKQSAKVPGRPVFDEVVSRIESGEATGILSWHPDRLARNSIDGGKIIYLIDTGKLLALKFPQFWFEPTPQGKFMLSLAFGQSKYYVDSLSENTKRGLHQKAKSGVCPGLAPIGYLNDPVRKTVFVDSQSAPVVVQAFELYAQGKSSLDQLGDFFFQKGIKSSGGKRIHRDRVAFMLSNPYYYGNFRYCGEIHEGKHEPIITKKLFDEVQEVTKGRSKSWKLARVEKIPKPLVGLFRCGECGMMITADVKKKYYPQTDHHATYAYYRCTKKSKLTDCKQQYIVEADLDKELSQLMQKVSLRPDWKLEMLKKLEEEKKEGVQSGFAFAAEKKKEIESLDQKLKLLLDGYLDQVIDRPDYLRKKSDLVSKKKTIEEQISSSGQKQNAWLEPLKEWIMEAANAASIANGNDLYEKKVLALKMFGSNLTLKDKRARAEGVNAWAALRAAPPTRGWVQCYEQIRTLCRSSLRSLLS